MGNKLSDLIIVVDNAPCHSRLEAATDGTTASILRLVPHSPMLNPIEAIWSKIKAYVKSHLHVPNVTPPGVTAQRLAYLEGIIDDDTNVVVGGDCARVVQHTTAIHPEVLAMHDMQVGR